MDHFAPTALNAASFLMLKHCHVVLFLVVFLRFCVVVLFFVVMLVMFSNFPDHCLTAIFAALRQRHRHSWMAALYAFATTWSKTACVQR